MSTIRPFEGYHYDSAKVGDISQLITPPYDVISKEMEKVYWERSPYNFAHIDLPKSENETYTDAAARLRKWIETGVMKRDPYPSYYLYRQTFTALGKSHVRDCLMASVKLHEYAEKVVLPHENTFGKAKTDRLNLMRATQFQLSPIFAAIRDSEGVLDEMFEKWVYSAPLFCAKGDDGVEHQLWRTEGTQATELEAFFRDKSIYILDGHHRYESSVNWAKEAKTLGNANHPAAFALFSIVNAFAPGVIILPTHRVVKTSPQSPSFEAIGKLFEIQEVSKEQVKQLVSSPAAGPQFAIALAGKTYVLFPKSGKMFGKGLDSLSVAWSDKVLLPEVFGITDENRSQHLVYEKDSEYAWQHASAVATIFHPMPTVESVLDIADQGGFMPQKSTFFYPKLASGIILRSIEGDK